MQSHITPNYFLMKQSQASLLTPGEKASNVFCVLSNHDINHLARQQFKEKNTYVWNFTSKDPSPMCICLL